MEPMKVQCPECGDWTYVTSIKRVFTEPITYRWDGYSRTDPPVLQELKLTCRHTYNTDRWTLVMWWDKDAQLVRKVT